MSEKNDGLESDKPTGVISAEIMILEAGISALQQRVDELTHKMRPILGKHSMISPIASEEKAPIEDSTFSPVKARIEDCGRWISRIVGELDTLSQNVEV